MGTFILPGLPGLCACLLAQALDLWEVGQRALLGASWRPLGPGPPQLQPQTMGLTLAPEPGIRPGTAISLLTSGAEGNGKSLWSALGASCPPVPLLPSLARSLARKPGPGSRPAHPPCTCAPWEPAPAAQTPELGVPDPQAAYH